MDATRCKEKISGSGRYGGFHLHQCSRKIWKDGYCKTHHPDSVNERSKKSMEDWQKKEANSPLNRAKQRIKELEAEIRLLKGETP